MPWTIPNLLLHDKPVTLSNRRALGYTKLFVYCSNPDCHHYAVIDASEFPDEITYNGLQPRMVCTVCDHRGADVRTAWHEPFAETDELSESLLALLEALGTIHPRCDFSS